MEKKNRLGRGLDSLLGNGPGSLEAVAPVTQTDVPLDQIQHNPYQPRKTFDDEELAALGDSIRTHGVLQPLVVRQVGEQYQVVAGERRLRAAQMAGLEAVPVRIVDFNDQQVLEAALVENIHRTDLNPIEKAQGFKEYLDRFQMTHEQLAARLKLARPTITNLVSLLDLSPEIQEAVRTGQVTLGHAKILKGISDPERQLALCKEVVARGLSVHGLDALLKDQQQQKQAAQQKAAQEESSAKEPPVEKTAHVKQIEDELRQKLAVKVDIKLKAKDRGSIVLGFESNDDFERLLEVLRR
jgi:ParB family chromosome partitioning protein